MDESKVSLIFGVLSVVLLVGILWGAGSVLKGKDREKESGETAAGTMDEIAGTEWTGVTETADETGQEGQTTEELTEWTTEAVTEAKKIEDDRTPPMFLTLSRDCEIKQGEAFDIQKYVGYGDDVDRSPVLTVDGTVDTSVLGTYPLALTLTDAAGHGTTANMNVKVVSERTAYQGGAKMDFGAFEANYKGEDTVLGIDVSRWQEEIDFVQVKNAGCEFVIIRIGGYDDGSLYTDKYFLENIKNAKAAGLLVGIYWHAEESTIREVKDSVAYLMDILDGEPLDFPIAYDWEDFAGFQNYEMNFEDLNSCFEAFCDEVKSRGYEACLYSSKNFLETVWENPKGHPVWLANYTSKTSYEGDYFMWQQGNTGRIPGIYTDVDFDIWYRE